MIIPAIVICRQHLCVELLVIIPVIIPFKQYLCVELLVIIPAIVQVDTICV